MGSGGIVDLDSLLSQESTTDEPDARGTREEDPEHVPTPSLGSGTGAIDNGTGTVPGSSTQHTADASARRTDSLEVHPDSGRREGAVTTRDPLVHAAEEGQTITAAHAGGIRAHASTPPSTSCAVPLIHSLEQDPETEARCATPGAASRSDEPTDGEESAQQAKPQASTARRGDRSVRRRLRASLHSTFSRWVVR